MTRNQLATYCLIAAAFVTTSLICVRASSLIDTRAHAEMAVHKDTLTMISTRYRSDSEIIYVLDSRNERLLAYMMDPNKKVIELLPGGTLEIGDAFGKFLRNSGAAAPKGKGNDR